MPDILQGCQDIKAAVMKAGAAHIQFNPVADTFAAKALLAMADKERLPLRKEAAKSLVAQAAGDLFHAIEMLQLNCVGKPRKLAPSAPKKVLPNMTVCLKASPAIIPCHDCLCSMHCHCRTSTLP